MADDPTPQNPQVPPQGDPVPATPPNPPPTDPTPPPGDPEPADVDGLKRALASERANAQTATRDAKAKERRIAELEAKIKEREDAEKSDIEKAVARAEAAEKRATDLEARNRQIAVRHATADAARDAGFADPADVYRFLDLDDLEYDAEDQPVGIADRVKDLAKAKPYLLAPKNTTSAPPPTPKSDRPSGQPTAEEVLAKQREFASHTVRNF